MSIQGQVDFGAVARVSRRAELRDIRLRESIVRASLVARADLEAQIEHQCKVETFAPGSLVVVASFRFRVMSEAAQLAEASFSYQIDYDLVGDDAFSPEDIDAFAYANGTYHCWPFVRQLLYDMTARMGYPPYMLPVFRFNPKPTPRPKAEASNAKPEDSTAQESPEPPS